MNKTLLISFEGIECSGKSTQIQKFKKYLEENTSYQIHLFREPGTTSFGEKVRSLLLDSHENMNSLSELFLFLSSRAELIEKKLKPLLKNPNTIIILDRYLDSSIAYQGAGRNLGPKFIEQLHEHAFLNLKPDLTFYLDISLPTFHKRLALRDDEKDRMEKENDTFFEKIRNEYLNISKNHPERFKVINAEKTPDEVFQSILKTGKKFL